MKAHLASAALFGLVIGSLQACKSPEPPFPQSVGDNEYLFLVIPKDAEITPEALVPAAERASAFCGQFGKEHVVNVEPQTIVQARREVSAFYFSCCKAPVVDVEPQTVEEAERLINAPYVWCE